MDNASIKRRAKELVKGQFSTVLLTAIVVGAIMGPVNGIKGVGNFISLILAGPLAVGALAVYTTVTAGEQAQLEQIFSHFKTNLAECIIAHIVRTLFIALWSLLLVIPGIMKAYSYAMTNYLLHKEPELSAMDAIARSKELMNGHRMDLFVLDLSFIGWLLLTIVTFGIAYIWVGPYMSIAQTVFFDQLYYGTNNY